jgi:hypothetical protein
MKKIKLTRCLFIIPAQMNKHNTMNTLLNSSNQAYAIIFREVVERCKLPRIALPIPIKITSAFDGKSKQVREVARIDGLDIKRSKQK